MHLQSWLQKTGVSFEAFAEQIGVSRQTVNRWASGQFFPRPKQLQIILDATRHKVTLNDMLSHHLSYSPPSGDDQTLLG